MFANYNKEWTRNSGSLNERISASRRRIRLCARLQKSSMTQMVHASRESWPVYFLGETVNV